MEDKCRICNNKNHTTNEHKIFKEYFEMSREDLVSIIISLEVENNRLSEKLKQ